MNTRKLAAAFAATAMIFTLGACSSDGSSPNPTVTVTAAPAPTTPDYGSDVADQAFVSTLRGEFGALLSSSSDAKVISLGHGVCDDLDSQSGDVAAVLNYYITPPNAIDPYFAAYVIGASVPAYCPEYQPQVDAFIASGSGQDA